VTDYQILLSGDPNHLAILVREKLIKGWKLQGGAFCTGHGTFCQAIVLPDYGYEDSEG
jgi:hypothetical protein